MKKLTLLTLLTLMTLNSAFAGLKPEKVWTAKKTGRVAVYNDCFFANGRCNPEEMETELISKCNEAGYPICTTILKEFNYGRSSDNLICGLINRYHCVVMVKGSLE